MIRDEFLSAFCGPCKSKTGKTFGFEYKEKKDIFYCKNCGIKVRGIIMRNDPKEFKLDAKKRLNELKNKKPSFCNIVKCLITGHDIHPIQKKDIEITHTNIFRQAKYDGIKKVGICKRCYKPIEKIEVV